jgi:hypothetical protein
METGKKCIPLCAAVLLSLAAVAYGQQVASVTLNQQTITIKYSAPAANSRVAGSFHTDADLAFKGLSVPKGDYTVYVLADSVRWQLAFSKATGPNAPYDPKQTLGRVPMLMIRPLAPVTACKLTLAKMAPAAAELQVVCSDKAASTSFRLDRGSSDSEW